MAKPEYQKRQVLGSEKLPFKQIEDGTLITDPFIKRSATTAAGATPANNTLVDDTLTEPNDFWNDMAIRIRTGDCAGELRRILDYDLATNTLTVNGAFSNQIVAGVKYVMSFPYKRGV